MVIVVTPRFLYVVGIRSPIRQVKPKPKPSLHSGTLGRFTFCPAPEDDHSRLTTKSLGELTTKGMPVDADLWPSSASSSNQRKRRVIGESGKFSFRSLAHWMKLASGRADHPFSLGKYRKKSRTYKYPVFVCLFVRPLWDLVGEEGSNFADNAA